MIDTFISTGKNQIIYERFRDYLVENAIPNARYVPSLLCHERFNEASLPDENAEEDINILVDNYINDKELSILVYY